VVAGVALVGFFAIQGATAKAWECASIWEPAATPPPAPGASPRYGYVQPDMGANHRVAVPQAYAYCPPASGNHYQQPRAPIEARFYGPDDPVGPPEWIHNLEHGGLVILYRGREGDPGLTEATQQQLRDLWGAIPASPVCGLRPGQGAGPVIARFDDMVTPFAAAIWNRVLPLDTLDTTALEEFWTVEGEPASVPELPCQRPSPSPGASAPAASPAASSPAASASPAASGSPAAGGSPAASPASS
jgi:hypothetical protein